MRSHTVPQRLLKQFAYHDANTDSLRLWRYTKGRPPYPGASPKSATRLDGFFAHPNDAEAEAQLEARLAQEVEDPVNAFLADFADTNWTMTEAQRRQMTRYVSLLFQRSRARRSAGGHIQEIKAHALRKFLSNDTQLITVAAHWGIKAHFVGHRFPLITREYVAKKAQAMLADVMSPFSQQEAFVGFIARAITMLDEPMFRGEWGVIRTSADKAFILSDAPVVTWARSKGGRPSYGLGFHTQDIEVALPISP